MLNAREELLAFFPPRCHCVPHLLVGDWVEIAKAQVFQLAANFAHPQAVSDRAVNVQCFLRDLLLTVGRQVLERAHVVQPVGQLDEDDADVVHHGEHHFA